MNFNIIFDYPFWFLLLCVLCGLLYSALLYYRNTKDGFHVAYKWVLAIARFIAVTVIALLLLAPLIEKFIHEVEDPLLIFLQDNSQSVSVTTDSAYYHNQYIAEVNEFLGLMDDDFDTRLYTFGESVSLDSEINFTERVTNMSEIFRELDVRYSNRNIGAVILAGDGIHNRGINPFYASANVNYPLYTIAMGDTLPRRDLILKRVNHNRISYLGNRFPVEVDIEAFESRGMSSRLTVSRNNEVLFNEVVSFTSDHHVETISLHLEADEPGMQQYTAALSPLEDEVSLQNNSRDFFIDIIDGRQQILILANSPHPDVAAIKHALEANDHYEVKSSLFKDFTGSPKAFDLIIAHQLPSRENPARSFFEQAENNGNAILFFVGSKTDISAFNDLQNTLIVQPRSEDFVETLAHYNRAFVLFSLQENSVRLFDVLPPLFSPFASYRMASDASVLLNQRIGQVVTEYPLILFYESGQRRNGVITGEGIWRWRLNSFMRDNNHDAFDDMLSRIVQYLAIQEDRSLFRVQSDQLVFENEPVLFEAELYNRSYELINEPEVQLFINNEEGTEFSYIMGRTTNAYRLDAGTFPTGNYSWNARVTVGGEVFTDDGIFNVRSLNLERLQTIANHNLLFQLAGNSNAAMFYPGQWDELRLHINNRDDIKPRLFSHKEFVEIINMKALFFVVLVLLSLEWFFRKRGGGY